MESVTLSWSVKNFITVNLMLALAAGAGVLGWHLYQQATGAKTPAKAAA